MRVAIQSCSTDVTETGVGSGEQEGGMGRGE